MGLIQGIWRFMLLFQIDDDHILVAGGRGGDDRVKAATYIYNVLANEWTLVSAYA